MSASDVLRKDHEEIMKLEKVISSCYQNLYEGHHIPFTDIEKITFLISEFLDSIHFTREEGSYFPCVASYDTLRKEISALLIEHEFSRNIAKKLSEYLAKWKNGEDMREPVARYLRTYSIFLIDHMSKEEDFFAKAENTVLSKEEEREMYEQFTSDSTISTNVSELLNEIKQLQEKSWFTNKS